MEGDIDDVARMLTRAAVQTRAIRDRVGWPKTHRERFRGLYDERMDNIVEHAHSRNVTIEEVERVYPALVTGDRYLTSHRELMRKTGMDYHTTRQAAAVYSDIGDVHECYDDDWSLYWVRCDEFIRQKCEDRRISLCRYYQMHDILREFQDKVIGWYVRRNRRQKQPFNLRDLKEKYVHRIQSEYFPDKEVGDEWSRHIAARYLRTAQDSIVRAYDLTY